MTYLFLKLGLAATLAAACVAAIASGFPFWALGASGAVTMLLCWVVYIHRRELPILYRFREARVLERFPTGKIFGVIAFTPISLAPAAIIIGLCFVAGGYYAVLEPISPSRWLFRLLFDAAGPAGIAATYLFLGIVLVVHGVETIIGHRLRLPRPSPAP